MLFLYLDIDGVAIPDRQAAQSITFAMSNRLRRILDRTGAKLVISSHRRTSKLTVLNLLSAAGFTRHDFADDWCTRSEEHTSELQSLMRSSYAVFCLKNKKLKI